MVTFFTAAIRKTDLETKMKAKKHTAVFHDIELPGVGGEEEVAFKVAES